MDFVKLLILQFIAHVLADFIFQNDEWSIDKKDKGFRSGKLYLHILIVFCLSWVLSFQLNFVLFSLVISLVHLVIDGFKFRIADMKTGRKKPLQNIIFFIDQSFHIAVLILVVIVFKNVAYFSPLFNIPVSNHHLLILAGYLVCLKPSNIFIREVFNSYNISMVADSQDDLLKAGRLIGNIERILTLTLLLMSQFGAVGFLIAAKSILRYEGKKTSKTEYVLIGSLLSFGIGIITGIALLKLRI
jgi:hypothetical protein